MDEQRGPSSARIVGLTWAATWVFVGATVLTAALPDVFVALGVALSALLSAAGVAAFAVGYGRAVQRSRTEELDLPGLFFLHGSAPKAVQRRMMLSLVVQLVAGVAGAAWRPFTPLAFGTLVPVFGLGMAALWGATHGSFPARRHISTSQPARRRSRRSP